MPVIYSLFDDLAVRLHQRSETRAGFSEKQLEPITLDA